MLEQKYIDVCEKLDWTVYTDDEDYVELETWSPAGEHIVFQADVENFLSAVSDYAKNFNENQHVIDMVQAGENGLGGVPPVKILVDDAEKIHDMLDDLVEALVNADENELRNDKQAKIVGYLVNISSEELVDIHNFFVREIGFYESELLTRDELDLKLWKKFSHSPTVLIAIGAKMYNFDIDADYFKFNAETEEVESVNETDLKFHIDTSQIAQHCVDTGDCCGDLYINQILEG